MENPCKIVCFGDSITKAWVERFNEAIREEYSYVEVINEGVVSQTTNNALERLQDIINYKPQVVTLGFGMNDWRKNVDRVTFMTNIKKIVSALQEKRIRVILLTINPDNTRNTVTPKLIQYNQDIKDIAYEKKVRIADVYSLWVKELPNVSEGLYDEIHPNDVGNRIIIKSLMQIVPRSNITIVWQFNGEFAFCNYYCPYCYVPTGTNVEHRYTGTQEIWHKAFKESFGAEKLTFYLSFGEPMASQGFYDVLSIIESEPNWEGHMTSNLSLPLDRLVNFGLVKQGRFHINASFHPSQTTVEKFMQKLFFLRDHGIECPVVYVMYPPQMQQFKTFIEEFTRNNFLVHVRRFRGKYMGKTYPQAYTEEERRFIARYCDDATIKYMLNELELDNVGFSKKLTYAGMFYILVTCEGDVYMCPDYKGKCLGNVVKNNVRLYTEPQKFEGLMDGTIDGIASLLELHYKELEGNHVMSYAKQGGVYKESGRIIYSNLSADFDNRGIRRKYRFPDGFTKMRLKFMSMRSLRG
jgi:lysophospholipase L1-like esterase